MKRYLDVLQNRTILQKQLLNCQNRQRKRIECILSKTPARSFITVLFEGAKKTNQTKPTQTSPVDNLKCISMRI